MDAPLTPRRPFARAQPRHTPQRPLRVTFTDPIADADAIVVPAVRELSGAPMICGEFNERRPPAMRRLGGGDATWLKAVSSSARHNSRPQLASAPSLPVALPPLRPGAVPPPPSSLERQCASIGVRGAAAPSVPSSSPHGLVQTSIGADTVGTCAARSAATPALDALVSLGAGATAADVAVIHDRALAERFAIGDVGPSAHEWHRSEALRAQFWLCPRCRITNRVDASECASCHDGKHHLLRTTTAAELDALMHYTQHTFYGRSLVRTAPTTTVWRLAVVSKGSGCMMPMCSVWLPSLCRVTPCHPCLDTQPVDV